MITVLDTLIDHDNSLWFKVKLERNIDVLARELFTKEDVEAANNDAVIAFIKWQQEHILEEYEKSK